MDLLSIDGSFGEGGGQIVRTAAALSCVTGRPIRLENIRAGRRSPGLGAQHLAAVRILGRICRAEMRGLKIGSTSVEFVPHGTEDAEISEHVGTAGSIPLILQAVVPAVSLCGRRLKLSITGGTDVSWSPTVRYMEAVLGEAYGRMGIDFSMRVRRRGYYPRGGGRVDVEIRPCGSAAPIVLDRRTTRRARLYCSFSKLRREAIMRDVGRMAGGLESAGFEISSTITEEDADDAGGAVLVTSSDGGSVTGADALYDVRRGGFGRDVPDSFAGATLGVDDHLADMLVVPGSLAGGMSVFRVTGISRHLETNLHVASRLTGCRYGIGRVEGGFEVRLTGSDPRV